MAMTANEIRIEQAERRLYAILDRQTRLIEGLMKSIKPDDLEEDLQKNLKETNGMLDDCFWQFSLLGKCVGGTVFATLVVIAFFISDKDAFITSFKSDFKFLKLFLDRKSTRLNSSHSAKSRMPSSA